VVDAKATGSPGVLHRAESGACASSITAALLARPDGGDEEQANRALEVELLTVCSVTRDKPIPPDDGEPRLLARPDVNQGNIDHVTAELGRHAGDVGEKKRLEVLIQKRRSDSALEGAKTRAKKARPKKS
jgi:hypothetical protein